MAVALGVGPLRNVRGRKYLRNCLAVVGLLTLGCACLAVLGSAASAQGPTAVVPAPTTAPAPPAATAGPQATAGPAPAPTTVGTIQAVPVVIRGYGEGARGVEYGILAAVLIFGMMEVWLLFGIFFVSGRRSKQ